MKAIPNDLSEKSESVALWVVVLSAVAGALILMLLVYLLYKVCAEEVTLLRMFQWMRIADCCMLLQCGFFKRNRPSDAPEKQPLNRNGHYQSGDEALWPTGTTPPTHGVGNQSAGGGLWPPDDHSIARSDDRKRNTPHSRRRPANYENSQRPICWSINEYGVDDTTKREWERDCLWMNECASKRRQLWFVKLVRLGGRTNQIFPRIFNSDSNRVRASLRTIN